MADTGSRPYWLQSIQHRGSAPFNSDAATYPVFRNVKDYGAAGDGLTDDTAAINAAISAGARCGLGCPSTTTSPALVYFPTGDYVVSSPIIALYYTQIVGDARNLPTIRAASNFTGMAVIDADPYIPDGWGAQYYVNQNNFFRAVRNIHIDLRAVPAQSTSAVALHWQVSQATSLYNIHVHMSTEHGNTHQGIFMENGSGGFMGDLVFNGGHIAMHVGNQQFTVRNVTINHANIAVQSIWNWGWTWQGITITNCTTGFHLTTGGPDAASQGTGATAITDARVTHTPTFVQNSKPSDATLAGSLVLRNIVLQDVPVAVGAGDGLVVLAGTQGQGGTKTIDGWAQGNVYEGTSGQGTYVQGPVAFPSLNGTGLLAADGTVFGRGRPAYEDYTVDEVVSVKSAGAAGDGETDDTQALQAVLTQCAGSKIVFLDAGVYYITDTLHVPVHTRLVGEAWSVLLGGGPAFQNMTAPRAVVRVGHPGDEGVVEISDVVFSTRGPAPAAIVVEWNVRSDAVQGGAGMWDCAVRLGGSTGTNLQANATDTAAAMAAYLALHITEQASGYFEGTWLWLADHDLDDADQATLTLYSGRGLLSHAQGPVWLVGTASEHHVLYQYSLVRARRHWMGVVQTESPYFQPTPPTPAPFTVDAAYDDPPRADGQQSAWAVSVQDSSDIVVFGAGLYSFFASYTQTCLASKSCQTQLLDINMPPSSHHVHPSDAESGHGSVYVYSLSTVGATAMLSVDGTGVVPAKGNESGFQDTMTAWTA